MAVTVLSSGTITMSSSGSEQIIYTTTSPGVFVLTVDAGNMQNGDGIGLRAKGIVLSSTDLTRVMYEATFMHAQTERLKASVPVVGAYGVSFTIFGTTDSRSTDYQYRVDQIS